MIGETVDLFGGTAWHRGSVRASHPAVSGSIPGVSEIFSVIIFHEKIKLSMLPRLINGAAA